MNRCADALADRLEQEARTLANEASTLTTAEWETQVPRHGDVIGAMVDHVAGAYLQLTQTIAGGQPVAGVMGDAVNEMSAGHAREHEGVTREAALDLLRNGSAAAEAIRGLSDEELDRAALC